MVISFWRRNYRYVRAFQNLTVVVWHRTQRIEVGQKLWPQQARRVEFILLVILLLDPATLLPLIHFKSVHTV